MVWTSSMAGVSQTGVKARSKRQEGCSAGLIRSPDRRTGRARKMTGFAGPVLRPSTTFPLCVGFWEMSAHRGRSMPPDGRSRRQCPLKSWSRKAHGHLHLFLRQVRGSSDLSSRTWGTKRVGPLSSSAREIGARM